MRPWFFPVLFILSLVGLIAICLGCSGKLLPMFPDEVGRLGAGFPVGYQWALWDSGLASIQYKNIDLSVLVNGGPEHDGTLDEPAQIDGSHWTLATTVEKNFGSSPVDTSIKYAWLDDQDPDGPSPEAVTA